MVGDAAGLTGKACSAVKVPDASIPKRGEADGSRRPSRLPFFLARFLPGPFSGPAASRPRWVPNPGGARHSPGGGTPVPRFPILAGLLPARGALISIADNVYRFATPIGRPDHARNLRLPALLRLMLLNMNLHRMHHTRPALPWWALPEELCAVGEDFDAPFFAAALTQLTGPVAVADLSRSVATASSWRNRSKAMA